MGDLDSLLQDFSYLKSLEHKNIPPKKAHKKLLLPDPSVHHAIRLLFEETQENKFDRIFQRPIGHRCFKEFIEAEYAAEDSGALACLELTIAVKTIRSVKPDVAVATALDFKAKHIDDQRLLPLNLWSAEENQTFERRLEKLRQKCALRVEKNNLQQVAIKELLTAFTPAAKDYLSQKPWQAFQESRFFIRYCQWKHLELNMKINELDFDVHRILGRGGFGEVYGCRKHDTGHMFAMKKLSKKRLKVKHQETSAVHERNVLAEMHSKFVTNLKYAFHNNETLFLILDLMSGGDLSWHLKKRGKFTEQESKFYTAEIIMGIAHIHSRKMIYRDLKPANILLDQDGHARISDLGLVRDITKSLPTSECGTHGYMAPEVVREDVEYTQAADWFSLGCVTYQMLTGHSPFRSHKMSKEEVDRRTLEHEVKYPSGMPEDAKDFLSQLLDRNPETRLGGRGKGAAEVRAHPWFNDMDWQALVDHQIQPAIRPEQGQVNAKDVFDIDKFDQHDVKRVTISGEDNEKYYRHFDHIMSHQWQEEVSVMYDMVTGICNKEEAKHKARVQSGAEETEVTGAIHQGYLLKQGSGLFKSFKRRYFHLFADRLEWRVEQLKHVKSSLPVADLLEMVESDTKDGPILTLTTAARAYVFRAEHASDHKCWCQQLEAVMEQQRSQKGRKHIPQGPSRASLLEDELSQPPLSPVSPSKPSDSS